MHETVCDFELRWRDFMDKRLQRGSEEHSDSTAMATSQQIWHKRYEFPAFPAHYVNRRAQTDSHIVGSTGYRVLIHSSGYY